MPTVNIGSANQSFLKSCFIQSMDSPKIKLVFQSFPDGGIQDSKTANWNSIDIPGRSHALLAYQSSANREISVGIMFYDNVATNVRNAKALAYPSYNGGLIVPPPLCRIVIGQMIDMYGVCSSVNVQWLDTLDLANGISHIAQIELSFQECWEMPWSSSEVMSGAAGAK